MPLECARCRLSSMGSVAHTSGRVVQVRISRLGGWQVSVPGDHGPLGCENLDEARRIAQQCVAHGHARELIVYDAYDRVLERKLIDESPEDRAA